MALLSLTINNPSAALDKQHSESQFIHRALQIALADIRSAGGKKTSGNIIVDGGVNVGSWTYTPVASS